MLRCRGQYILTASADGLTKAACIDDLLRSIGTIRGHVDSTGSVLGVAIGCRSDVHGAGYGVRTSWVRVLGWHLVQALTSLVIGGAVTDVQSSVKLFTR